MSLEKWAEYGWLKVEPTSRDEIKSLLMIVEREHGGSLSLSLFVRIFRLY